MRAHFSLNIERGRENGMVSHGSALTFGYLTTLENVTVFEMKLRKINIKNAFNGISDA